MAGYKKEYLDSQRGKLSEALKKAFLAGQNIVYAVTTDYSIVREMLRYQPLILTREKAETKQAGAVNHKDGIVTVEKTISLSQTLFFGLDGLKNLKPQAASICVVLASARVELNVELNAVLKQYVAKVAGLSSDITNLCYSSSMVIVVTPVVPEIPAEIAIYCRIVRVENPADWEIRNTIIDLVRQLDGKDISNAPGKDTYLRQVLLYTKGLTLQKIRQTFSRIKSELDKVFVLPNHTDEFTEFERIIVDEKTQMIENSGILKLQKSGRSLKQVNGMQSFVKWLEMRHAIIENPEEAKRCANIPQPKGVLLSGIPGTGKSLAAKTTAHVFGDLPLLQLDMGNIMDKYQGESEHKLEEALKLTEAMSPCVLWIDEIEKGIAGASGGSGSSDSMQRIFGKLLTWMQEKEDKGVCCFVFATANSIDNIPPELFRSGRFDEKFFTFLPSASECIDIFREIIIAQNKAYAKLNNMNGNTNNSSRLFAPEISSRHFFKKILDSNHVLPDRDESVKGKAPRENKFMTGSDIEAIIERAKLIMFHESNANIHNSQYVYGENKFEVVLLKAIDEIKTYGQTNARNVALCFSQLAEYNFTPVSEKVIVPFEFYEIPNAEDGEKFPFDLTSEKARNYRNSLLTDYDREMFRYLGMAVNQYIKPNK